MSATATLPPPSPFDALDLHDFDAVERESGVLAVERKIDRRQAALAAKREGRAAAPRGIPDAAFEVAKEQAREMSVSDDWSRAAPRHLVALFALLHERVYGVPPLDLSPAQRTRAAGAASAMLKKHFGFAEDPQRAYRRAAAFLRWAWKREEGREARRRETKTDAGRVGWHLAFGGSLLTDYALDQKRNGGAR